MGVEVSRPEYDHPATQVMSRVERIFIGNVALSESIEPTIERLVEADQAEISFSWGTDGVERKVTGGLQIDGAYMQLFFYATATKDEDGKRLWRGEPVGELMDTDFIRDADLLELMQEAHTLVTSWTKADMIEAPMLEL